MSKYLDIKTLSDLKRLVEEQECEGSFLEFKSSRIFEKDIQVVTDDLSKEITAFANGGGGTLIIGIDETNDDRSIASKISGVENAKITAERLQQILDNKISPPIQNLEILEVQDASNHICFIVQVPKSLAGPHQAADLKYYARRQFQKMPMEHYEIEDIRNRSREAAPKVAFRIEFSKQVFTELVVENISGENLFCITFHISDILKGIFKWEAPALIDGISVLNSGEKYSYNLGSVFELFQQEELKKDNILKIKFCDRFEETYETEIVFNLLNYDKSSFETSDIDFLREQVVQNMKKTTTAVEKISKVLDQHLMPLTSNSGLKISQTTLEHLDKLKEGQADEAIWNPECLDKNAIQEVLKCSGDEAQKLHHYFYYNRKRGETALSNLEGVKAKTIKQAKRRFSIPGETL